MRSIAQSILTLQHGTGEEVLTTLSIYMDHVMHLHGLVKKKSPWFDINTNDNVLDFRYQTVKDYEPADGWVLVQRDFGASNRLINHPYFILYNKYSGILRIFVLISETISNYNKATIILKYSNSSYRSAILEHHSGEKYSNVTKEFNNNVPNISIGNDYAYSLPYWLHADFVMNYDPCTCNLNNPRLQFEVRLISQSTLSFKANGDAVPKDVLGRASSGKVGFFKLTSGVKTSTDAYTNTEKSIDVLQEIFNINDQELWNPINFVPGIGAALKVVDFLTGVFKSNKPNATRPIAYNISYESLGDITTNDKQRDVFLDIPGATHVLVPPTNIQYKNIMGVFTLLERPTAYARRTTFAYDPCQGTGYSCPLYNWEITLPKNFKYAINPAPGFKANPKIEVQLQYQSKNSNFVSYDCTSGSTVKLTVLGTSYQSFQVGYVKVAANFERIDSDGKTSEAIYVAKYPVNIQVVSTNPTFTCNTSMATSASISSICNTTDYKNRTSQYLRVLPSEDDIILTDNTDIKEFESRGNNESFLIFPNPPTDGVTEFKFDVLSEGYVDIEIIDESGIIVKTISNSEWYNSGSYGIIQDISDLSPGTYLCKIYTGDYKRVERLIIR